METATALDRAGHGAKAIGAAVGLSEATVWLRSAGVETRRPGEPARDFQPLVDVPWCRQMRDDGHAVEDMAGWLGAWRRRCWRSSSPSGEQRAEHPRGACAGIDAGWARSTSTTMEGPR